MLTLITILLCLVEALERFANYFLLPNLAITIAHKQGISKEVAIAMYYGYYSAASYLFNPIGAWIGERLNHRKIARLGLFFLAIGYVLFYLYAKGLNQLLLLPALGILATGHGCFKPNMVAIVKQVGELFGMHQEEQGLLLKRFYFSINLGGMLSGLGIIFLLPKIGFLPCVLALISSNIVLSIALRFIKKPSEEHLVSKALSGATAMISDHSKSTGQILLFIFFGFLFWISSLQMNTTIYAMSTAWVPGYEEAFTSINSVFVSLIIFLKLGPKTENRQLKLAFYLAGFGFLVLALWNSLLGLFLWYIFLSLAEVYISPVGQNYILTFARKYKTVLLGTWFVGVSLAGAISAKLTLVTAAIGYKPVLLANGILLLIAAPIFVSRFTAPEPTWSRELQHALVGFLLRTRVLIIELKQFAPAK